MTESHRNGGKEARLPSILVVDDDPLVIRAMDLLISRAGFHPIVCKTGEDALKQINGDSDIAAAVVDIYLPDINGLTLTQRLREKMGGGGADRHPQRG